MAKLDGTDPLLLNGYGSYEISNDPVRAVSKELGACPWRALSASRVAICLGAFGLLSLRTIPARCILLSLLLLSSICACLAIVIATQAGMSKVGMLACPYNRL